MAQLIEQSHTTQGSEVQIQSLITLCYLHTVNCIEKPKIKQKWPGMANLKKHVNDINWTEK